MNENLFVEVGELFEETQGPFAPESLPEDAKVFSRRFQRQQEDGNWRVLTLWAAAVFPTDHDPLSEDPPKGYEVSEQWEEIVCADPESPDDAIDTDYTSDWPYYTLFDSVAAANEGARSFITMDHLGNLNNSLNVTRKQKG